MTRLRNSERGFSLVELMVATAIFMVVCAAMFGLLQVSQQKYAIESQLSGSFQEARLGMDQIVRDINIAGYPTASLLSNISNTASFAASPFAWDPGYLSGTDCQIGGAPLCNPTPGAYDLIIETNPYPTTLGSSVSWIRYQLIGTTLYRGVVAKTAGTDPVSATSASGVMTPLVNNIVNYATGTLLTQITTDYPSMFPAGVQPPIFVYTCTTPSGPQPCTTAGIYNAPRYISDVDITLIVKTPYQDMQTEAVKLIELTGRGHRTNSLINW
jgi:prepilin-type N-terminal cleavage/methylation domain-containing protein